MQDGADKTLRTARIGAHILRKHNCSKEADAIGSLLDYVNFLEVNQRKLIKLVIKYKRKSKSYDPA